jgi:hypothetical protein
MALSAPRISTRFSGPAIDCAPYVLPTLFSLKGSLPQ